VRAAAPDVVDGISNGSVHGEGYETKDTEREKLRRLG
jgi:hypothetical protein